MKRVLPFLFFLLVLVGFSSAENGLNLIPVQPKLLKSLPSAIISGADNGYELPSNLDIGSNVLIARSQGRLVPCKI